MELTTVKKQKILNEKLRTYLLEDYAERCTNNRQYSLRSYAMSLEIDAGQLSRIMAGKRGFNQKTYTHLLKKLDLSAGNLNRFLMASEAHGFQSIEVENFKVIADWYHFAILELSRVEEFKSDIKWISQTLDITSSEARLAVERLIGLGYLKEVNNKWIDVSGEIATFNNDFTNKAFKSLQKQVLKGALEALENVDFKKRSQTTLTFALDQGDLEKLKEKIKKFNADLTAFVESKTVKDSVYQCSISLFPVAEIRS